MQTIYADKETNELRIKISGSISPAEAKTISVLIRRKVSELEPGFIVVDDLTEFKMSDPRAGLSLQSVLECFIERRSRGIVRIIGSSRTAIVLFSRFSQMFQSAIPILYIPSESELPGAVAQLKNNRRLAAQLLP